MNPFISGLPWAGPSVPSYPNYPAGANPWNATPLSVAPGTVYFTPSPSFAPTAQGLNKMFNQRDQALLYIDAAIGPYACLEDISAIAGIETSTPVPGAGYTINAQTWNATSFNASHVLALGSTTINTQVGDVLDLAFQGTLGLETGGSGTKFSFLTNLFVNQAGAGYVDTGIQSLWGMAGLAIPVSSAFFGSPVVLRGLWTIGSGHAGTFSFGVNGAFSTDSFVNNIGLNGRWTARLRHLRPY